MASGVTIHKNKTIAIFIGQWKYESPELKAITQRCWVVLRLYGPLNSLGHIEPVSYSLTLFLGRIRPTKWLTSTYRARPR